jgi:hypothetical protein
VVAAALAVFCSSGRGHGQQQQQWQQNSVETGPTPPIAWTWCTRAQAAHLALGCLCGLLAGWLLLGWGR